MRVATVVLVVGLCAIVSILLVMDDGGLATEDARGARTRNERGTRVLAELRVTTDLGPAAFEVVSLTGVRLGVTDEAGVFRLNADFREVVVTSDFWGESTVRIQPDTPVTVHHVASSCSLQVRTPAALRHTLPLRLRSETGERIPLPSLSPRTSSVTLRGLTPGRYSLEVGKLGTNTFSVPTEFERNGITQEIELEEDSVPRWALLTYPYVYIRIVDEDRRPIRNESFRAYDNAGSYSVGFQTGPDGHGVVVLSKASGLGPCSLTSRLYHASGIELGGLRSIATSEAARDAASTTEYSEIVVRRRAREVRTLRSSDGTPLPNVDLLSWLGFRERSDENGEVQIDPRGRWEAELLLAEQPLAGFEAIYLQWVTARDDGESLLVSVDSKVQLLGPPGPSLICLADGRSRFISVGGKPVYGLEGIPLLAVSFHECEEGRLEAQAAYRWDASEGWEVKPLSWEDLESSESEIRVAPPVLQMVPVFLRRPSPSAPARIQVAHSELWEVEEIVPDADAWRSSLDGYPETLGIQFAPLGAHLRVKTREAEWCVPLRQDGSFVIKAQAEASFDLTLEANGKSWALGTVPYGETQISLP